MLPSILRRPTKSTVIIEVDVAASAAEGGPVPQKSLLASEAEREDVRHAIALDVGDGLHRHYWHAQARRRGVIVVSVNIFILFAVR